MSIGARPNSPPHGSDAGANPVIVEHTPTSSLHEVSKSQSDAKRRLIGLSLMAASAFMFSVMSLSVHVLGRHLGAMQIGVFRFLVQGVICSCVMRYKGISWKPATTKIGWLLFLRGFLGSAAMLGYFYALTRMVLSDATVIVFTNPIFTSIFGAVVLKEGWTWIDFLATCVCFAGVVCVAQPAAIFGHSDGPVTATGSTVVPAVVALASAIVSSSGFVVIRVLGGLVDANVVVFWYGLVGVLMSMLATVAMETFVWSLTASQYGLILLMGVFAYSGQWCMSKGLQMEKTGPAVMMRYLDIVCSFIWQVTLLNEPVTVWSAVGALLVTSCAFVNPVKHWRAMRESRLGNRLQPVALDEPGTVDTRENTTLMSLGGTELAQSSPCDDSPAPSSPLEDCSGDDDRHRLLSNQSPVEFAGEIDLPVVCSVVVPDQK